MKSSYLATRVKELRNQKGLSQEMLAEESGISLRTVQRIENGESNPTGDTLKRLSHALQVTPDELIDWTIKENTEFLSFLNLSALSFIIFPLLGILIPFIMWTSKKDKIKRLNTLGRDLINFEITWNILLFGTPFLWFIISKTGLIPSLTFRTIIILIAFLYFLNMVLITFNTFRISNKKEVVYYSLLKFLK